MVEHSVLLFFAVAVLRGTACTCGNSRYTSYQLYEEHHDVLVVARKFALLSLGRVHEIENVCPQRLLMPSSQKEQNVANGSKGNLE